VVVVSIFNQNVNLARGGVIMLSMLLILIMACGYAYDYSELNIFCFTLPIIAPLMLWIGEFPVMQKLKSWQSITLRLALVLLPCAVAIAIAIFAAMQTASSDPYAM